MDEAAYAAWKAALTRAPTNSSVAPGGSRHFAWSKAPRPVPMPAPAPPKGLRDRLATWLLWAIGILFGGALLLGLGLLIAWCFGWRPTADAIPHFIVWSCGAFGVGAIGHAIIYGWDRLSRGGKIARFGMLFVAFVLLLIFAPRDHSHTTIFSPVPIGGDSERPAFDFYALDDKGRATGCKVAGGKVVPVGAVKWCPDPVGQPTAVPKAIPTPAPAEQAAAPPAATPRAAGTPLARAPAPTSCQRKVYGKCPRPGTTPVPTKIPRP